MLVFIAGQITTGALVAKRVVVSKSFALPRLAREMKSAVAGATHTTSASNPKLICRAEFSTENNSVDELLPVTPSKDRGETKRLAP
jgi:hypothetical protein